MTHRKVTLIQGIYEYYELLNPHIERSILNRQYFSVTPRQAFEWIILEAFERIYFLYTGKHNPNDDIFRQITTDVRWTTASSGIMLDEITGFYIKAPKLYDDNNFVDIQITERDILIGYSSDISLTQSS
jgi:hypothetical protein